MKSVKYVAASLVLVGGALVAVWLLNAPEPIYCVRAPCPRSPDELRPIGQAGFVAFGVGVVPGS